MLTQPIRDGYPRLRLFDPERITKGVSSLCDPEQTADHKEGGADHKDLRGVPPPPVAVAFPGVAAPRLRQEVSEAGLPPELHRVAELSRCRSRRDRSRGLLELARRVKGLPVMPDQGTLRMILAAWCGASGGIEISPKMWSEFRRLIRVAKHPIGVTLADAVRAAKASAAPEWVSRYADKPELVLLVKICRQLAGEYPNGVFPLSVRTAAAVADTSFRDARQMLERLRADGVLGLVEKGEIGPRSKMGSTWRYVGLPG